MCFLNLAEGAYLEQNEPFPLKTMNRRKYSFLKLTQFSQVNNVLHAAASKIDGFIGEMHVFFQVC
jgi:hypothetical protein